MPFRRLVQGGSHLLWTKANFLLKILLLLWSPVEVLISPESQFEEDPGTECFISGHCIAFWSFLLAIYFNTFCDCFVFSGSASSKWIFLLRKFAAPLCTVVSWPFIRISRAMNHFSVTARSEARQTVSFAHLQNFSLSYFWGQYSCLEPNKSQGIFYKRRYWLLCTFKEGMLMLNHFYPIDACSLVLLDCCPLIF